MIKNLKKKKQVIKTSNKGITLIALVITIIVLLILAGVAISTLTGENGILQKVKEAKVENIKGEERDKLALAYHAVKIDKLSNKDKNNMTKNEINKALKDAGITVKSITEDTNGVITVEMPNGNKYTITQEGKIDNIAIGNENNNEEIQTVADAKTAGTVFNKETIIYDKYNNKVVIPEGFKIASDSATEVAGGVVIEDARYVNTKGSQFVWIPVGTITGTVNGVEKTETITLRRYVFDEVGNIIESQSVTNPSDQIKTNTGSSDYFTEGLKNETTKNTHAKDIETFISSANNNKGYYLGRYESGITGYDSFDTSARTWTGTNMTLVCKADQQVYNYVTQPQAAELSRNMYASDLTFTSDLINSYAWDTAITFIQAFGADTDSATYSIKAGMSSISESEPQNTGTNKLKSTGKEDIQCNIYDMAGNCYEWTTETVSYSDKVCVFRGSYYKGTNGNYNNENSYTSRRACKNENYVDSIYAFRPILYL